MYLAYCKKELKLVFISVTTVLCLLTDLESLSTRQKRMWKETRSQ